MIDFIEQGLVILGQLTIVSILTAILVIIIALLVWGLDWIFSIIPFPQSDDNDTYIIFYDEDDDDDFIT
jgi:hypothetical protein